MLLEKLSNAIGVSGEEAEVRSLVIEAIREHVSDIVVDALGNVHRDPARHCPS